MKSLRSKPMVIVLCIILLSFSSISYAGDTNTNSSLNDKVDFLKIMVDYIQEYYVGNVTEDQLLEGAYKGLFWALDPYSGYLNPDEYTSLTIDTSESFGGIGIQVGMQDERIFVINPLEGGPAYKAGIKAGDEIVSIDGTDIKELPFDKAINLIPGEPGTSVQLGIVRSGNTDILYFNMIRETISTNPVQYKIVSGNIGYIRIQQFNQKVSDQVDKALDDFSKKNVKGVVLDLRDNPGGLLEEAVNVLDPFVPKGPVVYIEYKNKDQQTFSSITDKYNKPLAVLVNGGSASASELVAGAIQDTQSGVIIGTKTFGKGTVQSVIPMDNGGAVKLTMAKYFTPGKRNIHGIGIEPDIIMANPNILDTEGDIMKDFVPMIEDGDPSLGSKGLNVYGAQQRLVYMGYDDIEVTGIMDDNTLEAVQKFQKVHNLESLGVLDHSTRDKLEEKVMELFSGSQEDLQLKKAIEVILNVNE